MWHIITLGGDYMRYQTFNGIKFREESIGGYYIHNFNGYNVRMHRYVWEYYNGPIPDGYDIHHKDGNKSNNDISNLELMESSKHSKYHASLLTDEQREWKRNNLSVNARPKAGEWHKSEAGSEWHSEHIKQQHLNGDFKRELVCTYCKKSYIGTVHKNGGNSFCSNACKSAYRRLTGKDNIVKECPICGKEFSTSKFRPKITCSNSCANRYKWRLRKNEG